MKTVNGTVALPLICSLIVLSLVCVRAEEHFYDWTVSFSSRSILGVQKKVIVINDQFPGPLLNGSANDVLNVNIHNNLDEPFLMSWNGVQLRGSSWQDGVQGTNCPIPPGQNWTYSFQLKDQIGSYFYFPSLNLHKAAGGYGPIRIYNTEIVHPPFPFPDYDYDILIGDWYTEDIEELRQSLDIIGMLKLPYGILINGQGPKQASLDFQPGKTYMLRISNVGIRTSLNFKIQGHKMTLVETEGSYTVKQDFDNLDVHVGQSYSVMVKALEHNNGASYFISASPRFSLMRASGIGFVRYNKFQGNPVSPLFHSPLPFDLLASWIQTKKIRVDLAVGAARPNPQGSFHYGLINVTRTIVLEGKMARVYGKLRYAINGVSFVYPDTPLKLADQFNISGVYELGTIPERPHFTFRSLPARPGVSVIQTNLHDFTQIIFQNPLRSIQTWHLDGYNFFVVGMGPGIWSELDMLSYNLKDAVYRSTVQVYPFSWTAVYVAMDNQGMWNLRAGNADERYLGQELYIRVKGPEDDPAKISPRDEAPIPANAIKCGKAALL
nr:L-ascorbate oxidase homolog [Ipomoea batatas]